MKDDGSGSWSATPTAVANQEKRRVDDGKYYTIQRQDREQHLINDDSFIKCCSSQRLADAATTHSIIDAFVRLDGDNARNSQTHVMS